MEETQLSINDHINNKNYRSLFNFSMKDIQIYFDSLCIKGDNNDNVDILLKLFVEIDITNALIYAYVYNNKILFELLATYINDDYKTKNPDIVEIMITQSYNYHNKDINRYINRELLKMILNTRVFQCDDVFLSAVNSGIVPLVRVLSNDVKNETVIRGFEISYLSGNYSIARITYSLICAKKLLVNNNLGYCPSGSIILMIRYQEFYKWDEQFNNSVANYNLFALESLVKKMPYHYNVPFSMLEPIIHICPDSLLSIITNRINLTDIDSEYVASVRRTPLTDYYENRILKGDWYVLHNKDDY